MLRAYLVDTKSLTPDNRKKTLELLDASCFLHSMLGSQPAVFMAHADMSPEAFKALPFPEGCTITDVTGHDLLQYR